MYTIGGKGEWAVETVPHITSSHGRGQWAVGSLPYTASLQGAGDSGQRGYFGALLHCTEQWVVGIL